MAAKRAGKASAKPTKPAGKTTTKATTTTTKAAKATATTTTGTTGTGTGTEKDGDDDGNGEDEDAGEGEGEESREEDEQIGVDAGDERVPGAFVPRDAVVVRNILHEMVRASSSSANAKSFTKTSVFARVRSRSMGSTDRKM